MPSNPIQKSESPFSKRRLGLASVATVIGCAAVCAIPFLAAAGLGGRVAAALSSVLRPGSEFVVGAVVFLAVLGAMAVRKRIAPSDGAACGPSCAVDGGCSERGRAPKGA